MFIFINTCRLKNVLEKLAWVILAVIIQLLGNVWIKNWSNNLTITNNIGVQKNSVFLIFDFEFFYFLFFLTVMIHK